MTNVCGCLGFARDISGKSEPDNIIVADYTQLDGQGYGEEIEQLLRIDRQCRNAIEDGLSGEIAGKILLCLEELDTSPVKVLQRGYGLARSMSWDVIVDNYLIDMFEQRSQAQKQRCVCSKIEK